MVCFGKNYRYQNMWSNKDWTSSRCYFAYANQSLWPGDNYHPNDSHVIAALIRKFYEAKIKNKKEVICWGSGRPLREFLHVDDLASAVIFALEKWDPDSPDSPVDENGKKLFFLNVGTGKEISIKNLAYLIKDEINFSGDIKWDKSKPDGTPRKLLNVDRIKNLGWSPKIDLKEGIKETIKCFTKDFSENKLRFWKDQKSKFFKIS